MLYVHIISSHALNILVTDDNAGCGNVINPSNSAIAGILSPLGDTSCQTGCRGNLNEACGTTETFISIYEYTVSGFLRNACVPMLLLLCFLYVMCVFGGGGERSIERSAEEGIGGDQIGGLAVGEGGTGGAALEGPLCWDTGDQILLGLFFELCATDKESMSSLSTKACGKHCTRDCLFSPYAFCSPLAHAIRHPRAVERHIEDRKKPTKGARVRFATNLEVPFVLCRVISGKSIKIPHSITALFSSNKHPCDALCTSSMDSHSSFQNNNIALHGSSALLLHTLRALSVPSFCGFLH